MDAQQITSALRAGARELGFASLGISRPQLETEGHRLQAWWERGHGADMDYMVKHGSKRYRPAELIPGTRSVISVSLPYWPEDADSMAALSDPQRAYIARYALGRDYHKLMRKRLARLAARLQELAAPRPVQARAFVDSAPVLEKPLAVQAGLGWMGKNTLIIHRQMGSAFFLGEIYTDLELPPDAPLSEHCGSCRACIDVCPTHALRAPYRLDARLCISYLTIESREDIPEALRPALGNRIFGCDDCQLICPWNRYARSSQEKDLQSRHGLHAARLQDLSYYTESDYRRISEGSALGRIGYEGFLRNVAVGLGNARPEEAIMKATWRLCEHSSAQVRRHARWAWGRLHAGHTHV